MQELIDKVITWANERNIIQGSSAIKQLDKTSEEFNELQRAVALHLRDPGSEGAFDEVGDAFGDILVTLIIASHQLRVSLPIALEQAYNTIKDRRGEMVNGKFVKESDL